jgi:polygalacturonase
MKRVTMRNIVVQLAFVMMVSSAAVATAAPAPGPCDIRSFGATANDGRADTAAIQRAIDGCAGSGQAVIIPTGQFDSGGLTLRSNLHLHLAGGARLAMSIVYDDYAPRAEIENHRALIYGDQISNVEISGTGTIDGMAAPIYAEMDRIIAVNRDDPAADRRARFGLMLSRCSNVRVRDITIRDTPMFLMAVRQCDNVVLDGFTLEAPLDSHNTDGLQIIDSSDVRVTNCRISVGDDGITTKAQGAKAIERLIVDSCVIRSDDGAIKLGTQSRGVLRDSLFTNIAIVDSRYGIAAFMIRGGLYANNRFTNIRIATGGRHPRTYPIFVDIDDRERNAATGGVGRIDGLVFDNLDITTGGNMLIAGHPLSPIRDLTLSNIRFRSTEVDAIAAQHSKPTGNRRFRPVPGSPDYAPVDAHLVIGEAAGVRLNGVDIKGLAGSARKAMELRNVAGIVGAPPP